MGIKDYFGEIKGETKKVEWPTKEKVAQSTLVVLVIVVVITFAVSFLDIGFGQIIDNLIRRF